jgi:hypothetical protein
VAGRVKCWLAIEGYVNAQPANWGI